MVKRIYPPQNRAAHGITHYSMIPPVRLRCICERTLYRLSWYSLDVEIDNVPKQIQQTNWIQSPRTDEAIMKNDEIDKTPEIWSQSSGALAPNFYPLSDYERFDDRHNGLSRHGRLQFMRATGLMRSGTGRLPQIILSAILLCSPFATSAVGQSVPKERRITYREQSVKSSCSKIPMATG